MLVLFDIRNSSLAMVPLVPYTNVDLKRFVDCVFKVFVHPNRWSAQVPGAPQWGKDLFGIARTRRVLVNVWKYSAATYNEAEYTAHWKYSVLKYRYTYPMVIIKISEAKCTASHECSPLWSAVKYLCECNIVLSSVKYVFGNICECSIM